MSDDRQSPSQADSRGGRLRAALRENLARRKAQARARREGVHAHGNRQDGDEEKDD